MYKGGFIGRGIIVCGLNGSGKSSLGKALAEAMGFYFIDNEDLFFPKTDPHYIFANLRSREEVISILFDTARSNKNYVFYAVRGDYGKDIIPFYHYAVFIDVPKEIRLKRIRNRSFQKFGNRMLPGGDLYVREKVFFDMVSDQPEYYVEEWIQTLRCPILPVDGTKSIKENVAFIVEQLQKSNLIY